uniref:Uncharacterized protein n=1 Tax=Rhizophora mucronata TaxID=61149 RepID=A0A2P2N155_RHIMU
MVSVNPNQVLRSIQPTLCEDTHQISMVSFNCKFPFHLCSQICQAKG